MLLILHVQSSLSGIDGCWYIDNNQQIVTLIGVAVYNIYKLIELQIEEVQWLFREITECRMHLR